MTILRERKSEVVEAASKNGARGKRIDTVFVTFTGEDRTSSTGIPIDVKGWWEIRGLPFRAAQEVAYALANDLHMTCRVKRDVAFGRYPAGCTLVVQATVPDMVG